MFFVIGQTERERDGRRDRRSIIIGIGQNEAERGRCDCGGPKRLCAVAALQRAKAKMKQQHTRTHALAHKHTHIHIRALSRTQLQRKHNKKWRAYKIFRAFLFRIKIRTNTHAHAHRQRVCLRSRVGALLRRIRCWRSLPLSCLRSLAFEIRIKY